MAEERRENPNPLDVAGKLASFYTLGYFGVVFTFMFWGIPPENKDAINQLIGGLTIIQTGIIGFYFGGSKQVEATQRATEQRQGRSASVVEEIARTVPVAAVVAASAASGVPLSTPTPTKPDEPVAGTPAGDNAKGATA